MWWAKRKPLNGDNKVRTVDRPTLTVTHHDFQEFDDDFRTRPDQNLTFAPFLCVVNGLQRVAQYVHTHHLAQFSAEDCKKLRKQRQQKNNTVNSTHRNLDDRTGEGARRILRSKPVKRGKRPGPETRDRKAEIRTSGDGTRRADGRLSTCIGRRSKTIDL